MGVVDGAAVEDGSGVLEGFEAEVAALFGPLVVLLGQDRADEADHGLTVREDPDDVGSAADLAVEALLRVVRPDLAPDLLLNPTVGQGRAADSAGVRGGPVGFVPCGRVTTADAAPRRVGRRTVRVARGVLRGSPMNLGQG